MGRRRGHAPPRPAAATASSEVPVVGDHSITESSTPGGQVSTSRKRRRRSRGKKSTSTSKNPSTTAEPSIHRIDSVSDTYYPTSRFSNHGEMLVLFETPSGFAIFCMKEYYLDRPIVMEDIWQIFGEHFRAREMVWLKEFQILKDKTSAINTGTGVSRELTEMILRYHCPNQKLAVGKPEYKRIIETSLPGVRCLFDEMVMEVMWGLKNLMHSLVPQEKLQLTKEDCLPMSRGLNFFLYDHGFDVKPEMVNWEVIVAACLLRDTEVIEKQHSKQLCWAADKLRSVSGINSEGWGMMKIATALKIMFYPGEKTNDDMERFTGKEVSTLERNAHYYDGVIRKDISLKIYTELLQMREVKKEALEVLGFWSR